MGSGDHDASPHHFTAILGGSSSIGFVKVASAATSPRAAANRGAMYGRLSWIRVHDSERKATSALAAWLAHGGQRRPTRVASNCTLNGPARWPLDVPIVPPRRPTRVGQMSAGPYCCSQPPTESVVGALNDK